MGQVAEGVGHLQHLFELLADRDLLGLVGGGLGPQAQLVLPPHVDDDAADLVALVKLLADARQQLRAGARAAGLRKGNLSKFQKRCILGFRGFQSIRKFCVRSVSKTWDRCLCVIEGKPSSATAAAALRLREPDHAARQVAYVHSRARSRQARRLPAATPW